jgi:hypothetical protein
MYELLIVLIIILFSLVKAREHFAFSVDASVLIPEFKKGSYLPSWPRIRDIYSTDPDSNRGYEFLSTFPNSCPDGKEKDAGLCYEKCKYGYRGVGPVCWADTQSVGVGRPIGLEPCPDGWNNDGLICREPIRNDCSWKGLFGECWGKLSGGRLKGRLDNGGICDWPDKRKLPTWLVEIKDAWVYKSTQNQVPQDKLESTDPATIERKKILVASHPLNIAGLCYRPCPVDFPIRVPGMPYLCYRGGPLSYGRGVGTIPSVLRYGDKKYTFL